MRHPSCAVRVRLSCNRMTTWFTHLRSMPKAFRNSEKNLDTLRMHGSAVQHQNFSRPSPVSVSHYIDLCGKVEQPYDHFHIGMSPSPPISLPQSSKFAMRMMSGSLSLCMGRMKQKMGRRFLISNQDCKSSTRGPGREPGREVTLNGGGCWWLESFDRSLVIGNLVTKKGVRD